MADPKKPTEGKPNEQDDLTPEDLEAEEIISGECQAAVAALAPKTEEPDDIPL